MRTALLLIAHGSRVGEANEDLRELARRLLNKKEFSIVEASFLELAEPDIVTGARKCVEQGANRVVLLPYFLSAGIHFERDLEKARQQLADTHAGIEFLLAEPIGRHPEMLAVVLDRAREVCGDRHA